MLLLQCLRNRHIRSLEELNSTISDWEKDRNQRQIGVKWHFIAESHELD